eukprot:GHVU01092269.1.p1 GENE.GHVU01092269.1~~GHVU01092269.1.p1  ORF type:complete len:536 (-),score=30.70 GHVU01092269.1:768-2375(-)
MKTRTGTLIDGGLETYPLRVANAGKVASLSATPASTNRLSVLTQEEGRKAAGAGKAEAEKPEVVKPDSNSSKAPQPVPEAVAQADASLAKAAATDKELAKAPEEAAASAGKATAKAEASTKPVTPASGNGGKGVRSEMCICRNLPRIHSCLCRSRTRRTRARRSRKPNPRRDRRPRQGRSLKPRTSKRQPRTRRRRRRRPPLHLPRRQLKRRRKQRWKQVGIRKTRRRNRQEGLRSSVCATRWSSVRKRGRELVPREYVEWCRMVAESWLDKWAEIRKNYRITIDHREANKRIVTPAFPFPDLAEAGEFLAGSVFFASLDLVEGYTQCPLARKSQEYFALSTRRGIFVPTRVPMGASCSPAYFQAIMEEILQPILKKGAMVYLDDILVYGKTFEDFHANLRTVLSLLRQAKMKMSARKSVMISRQIIWCGRLWSAQGYEHLPSRVEALAHMPEPADGAQLYQMLSAANWMRESIPDYGSRLCWANITVQIPFALLCGGLAMRAFARGRLFQMEKGMLLVPAKESSARSRFKRLFR